MGIALDAELDIQGARFYPIRERDEGRGPLWVPSVTTVLKVWPKPNLIQWAARVERETILDDLVADNPMNLEAWAEKRRKTTYAHDAKRDAAADVGSSAHAWVEWHVKGMLGIPVDPEPSLLPGADRAVEGARAWMQKVNLVPIWCERRMYHPEVGYAGRADVKAEIDWQEGLAMERRVVIVDWKTSTRVYPDMLVQNAAYRMADRVCPSPGGATRGGVIVRLAKNADDPKPFEAKQVPGDIRYWNAFESAMGFWRNMRAMEGKWAGGYATHDEIAELQKPKRRGSKKP